MDTMMERFQDIDALNIIMEDFRIKLPERNKSRFKETQKLIIETKKRMEAGIQANEGNEIRFKRELQEELPKIDTEVKRLQNQLADPRFAQVDFNIKEACKLLDEIGTSVKAVQDRCKKVNDY